MSESMDFVDLNKLQTLLERLEDEMEKLLQVKDELEDGIVENRTALRKVRKKIKELECIKKAALPLEI